MRSSYLDYSMSVITNRALLALSLSMIAILIYISLRFAEWKMAIAAIIALAHDIIITLGIYLFWVSVDLERWIVERTDFADGQPAYLPQQQMPVQPVPQ